MSEKEKEELISRRKFLLGGTMAVAGASLLAGCFGETLQGNGTGTGTGSGSGTGSGTGTGTGSGSGTGSFN